MSGIVGSSPSRLDIVQKAVSKLRSRGPDSIGIIDSNQWSLGVARLAITDAAHGNQPITSRTRRSHIVFNGALYNARRLMRTHQLEVETGNDAEVVLSLYEKFGVSFTDHLDGMYAFIIADEHRDGLVFGVDEIGIKPLYIAREDGDTFLCSTLQAMGRNELGLANRVPAGTVWDLSGLRHMTRPREPVRDWREALAFAVADQIPEDVPWGCLLSGGLDSSVLCQLASRTQTLTTIACGLEEGSADLVAARRVAAALNTNHHEALIDSADLRSLAAEVVAATASFEPWLVLGGIGTLVASRAAAGFGMKVLLSGEGADELFGGYRDFDDVPHSCLEAALRAQQSQLGATECLRLDRCSMAAGVEVRVPYLSRDVVAAVRSLPVASKRSRPGSRASISKVALREFADSLSLPDEIVRRPKVGFSSGVGIESALSDISLSERDKWAHLKERNRFAAPGLDQNAPLYSWLLGLWLELYGDSLAASWSELARRGLVRT